VLAVNLTCQFVIFNSHIYIYTSISNLAKST
jgi:hypothetical protein